MSCDSAAAAFGKLSNDMASEIGGEMKKLSEELEGVRTKLNEINASMDGFAMKSGHRNFIGGESGESGERRKKSLSWHRQG